MGNYIQVLTFVVIGIVLLWFGYTLLIGPLSGIRSSWLQRKRAEAAPRTGSPGDPQVCPVCSMRLDKGGMVKSQAFPSITGGKDRLMYIRGCVYCLNGERLRLCPVCGASLGDNEILISRMFERPSSRSHVHVLGCSRCKKMGSLPGNSLV
jgi:hypothetical protein